MKYPFEIFGCVMLLIFLTGCQSDDSQVTNDNSNKNVSKEESNNSMKNSPAKTLDNLDEHLTEEASYQKLPSSLDGLAVKTEKAQYSMSVEEIIVEIQNKSDKEVTTGVHVFLEKQVEDTWYIVPMKSDAFTQEGMIHSPHTFSNLEFKTNTLEYSLTPGKYRATIFGLAAPFEILE